MWKQAYRQKLAEIEQKTTRDSVRWNRCGFRDLRAIRPVIARNAIICLAIRGHPGESRLHGAIWAESDARRTRGHPAARSPPRTPAIYRICKLKQVTDHATIANCISPDKPNVALYEMVSRKLEMRSGTVARKPVLCASTPIPGSRPARSIISIPFLPNGRIAGRAEP
jgi:hypothetical protein